MNNNSQDKLENSEIDELIQATMTTIKLMARRNKKAHNQLTLQTTEIVHETYLRLVKSQAGKWQNRNHFLITFSYVMKKFLVDQYRKKMTSKRGDGIIDLDVDSTSVHIPMPDGLPLDWIELELKLEELAEIDKDAHDIVLLRYFAGLEIAETAATLNISERTVSRKWTFARTWLHTNLT